MEYKFPFSSPICENFDRPPIYLGGLTVVFLNYKIFVCINVIIADKRKSKRSLDSENRYRGTKLT